MWTWKWPFWMVERQSSLQLGGQVVQECLDLGELFWWSRVQREHLFGNSGCPDTQKSPLLRQADQATSFVIVTPFTGDEASLLQPPQQGGQGATVKVQPSSDVIDADGLVGTPQDEHDEVLGVGEIDVLKQWPIGARHCPAGPIQGEAELMIKVEGRVAHVPRVSRIGDCAQFSCALRCWYGREPQVVSQLHHASQEAP